MKPIYGFWLSFAALVFRVLGFVPLLVMIPFALGALLMARSRLLDPRVRITLLCAALAMLLSQLPAVVGLIFLAILAGAVVVLGLFATEHRAARGLMLLGVCLLVVVEWSGWDLSTAGIMLAVVASLVVFGAIFAGAAYVGWKQGEEDAQRRSEGKPPKWEGLHDPNSPFKPFKKK